MHLKLSPVGGPDGSGNRGSRQWVVPSPPTLAKPVRQSGIHPKKLALIIATLMLAAVSFAQTTSFIPNPVLPGVADAGVIKFNGEYYIGGVFTKGSFYKSDDLIHWRGPQQVFNMSNEWATKFGIGNEQIHSNDINYVNGKFHMYWNVNYWGKDRNVIHIGHAVATDISGPFIEPVKDIWFDSRLDPKLFLDDDHRMYFYSVKFSDGNTIWARPMKDPGTLAGEPKYIFASNPNTWETIDNRVAEGPWVFKYRNRYYMMYNANHTSPEWGNYALGVAEASGPLEFNNGNKYPYPVVKSNQVDLEELHVDVLKYQGEAGDAFQYSLHDPGKNWNTPGFVEQGWQTGKAGFGSVKIEHSTARKVKTIWKDENIWLRKNLLLNEQAADNFALRVHHYGDTKVFLNGLLIYEGKGPNYLILNLDSSVSRVLKNGENTLAVASTKGKFSNFIDISLFDMKKERADDILFTPGQANLLHGPNGFEWWLIYMANQNNERRGQFINRVHFFDKKLVVDGITGANTPGYHPVPSQPTFGDLFNDSSIVINRKWNIKAGNWQIINHELVQQSSGTGQAFIKSDPAVNYLFEASVKMSLQNKAGMYAWWKDNKNWIKIVLDQKKKAWSYEFCNNDKVSASYFKLPEDFDYHVYHKLSVYKNDVVFTIKLDDLPAPAHSVIKTQIMGEGLPGLYTEGANAAFDGILFTIGWDEFDKSVTGWKPLHKGEWQTTDEGIITLKNDEESAVFKGDLLNAYEFSVQVKTEDTSGSVGVYPIWTDENNFIKAAFDIKNKQFIVSGKLNGQSIATGNINLTGLNSYYADMVNSDFMEKHFKLNGNTYINAMRFNSAALSGSDTLIHDIHNKINIFYKHGGQWFPLTGYRIENDDHPGFDKITFDPVMADELKFTNKDAADHQFYIYKIWVNELFRQSYNLRIVKQQNVITFFVDNNQVLQLENHFPASRVGLCSDNCKAKFNGITLFHLP